MGGLGGRRRMPTRPSSHPALLSLLECSPLLAPSRAATWWIRSVQMFRNTWETTARLSLRPWGFGMHWEMNGLEHRLGPLHQRWHKTCIASDLFTREFELRIYVSNMRFLNGWLPARFELRTYAFFMNFFISKTHMFFNFPSVQRTSQKRIEKIKHFLWKNAIS